MRGIIAAAVSIVFLCLNAITCSAQRLGTENIVIVTVDGLRWRELFEGPAADILSNEKYVRNKEAVMRYVGGSETDSRENLMPFMWKVVSNQGQLYGNRNLGNRVDCTNRHLISYPGYSEMLLGFKDPKVSSNQEVKDAHPTVLEAIANNFRFADEVAAFATWDAFNFILREAQSDIHVNAGSDLAEGDISAAEERLNSLQREGHRRTDSITFQYAIEYLKRVRPRVVLIGLDGPDHHAHAGRYDEYLNSANEADRMIGYLWHWLQSQPDYRNKTTLLVTTDHGRGKGKHNWRKHRLLARGSRHIWLAAIGPDTPAFGEMKIEARTRQTQVAKTIAAFLGLPYENVQPVGEVVQTMIEIPAEESAISVLTEQ